MTIVESLLADVSPIEFIRLPKHWGPDSIFILQVASCKHFKQLGIRKGSYIGIDALEPFVEGEPCAFLKIVKGEPRFRLSRTFLKGYECVGRLCLVVSFPLKEGKK